MVFLLVMIFSLSLSCRFLLMDTNVATQKIEALAERGWCVDQYRFLENGVLLEISGWALEKHDPDQEVFWVNGRPLETQDIFTERSDIDGLFDFYPKRRPRGFTIQLNLENWKNCRELRLSFGKQSAEHDYGSFYVPARESELLAQSWPEPERRFRVHGSGEFSPFVIEGLSCARKLELLVRDYVSKESTVLQQMHVLDWGCGCGRVARWLTNVFPNLSGVDIDADNVAWCAQHYPQTGLWKSCRLTPPIPFPDQQFDLIYGVSIFTHIAESAQVLWLQELKRLLRPGGVAIVSIHGPSSAARFRVGDEAWNAWYANGLLDMGPSRDLELIFGEHDHYRGTLHTQKYIYEEWSKVLEVEDIIPAVFGNHQDVVVLRNGRLCAE